MQGVPRGTRPGPGVGRRACVLVAAALALGGCVGGPAAGAGGAATAGAPTVPTASASMVSTPSEVSAPWASASPASSATDWRRGPTVAGFDVSRYNPAVGWAGLAASGHRFVYVKATEGTGHQSPTYAAQVAAAASVGLYRGAYHYARPASSDGATQARFFTDHGGAWVDDGRTLPGALDLEQSTAGPRCHGLSVAELRRWLREFSATYAELNGRLPVLYVKAEVWRECVGDSGEFADHPLWLFDHDGGPGPLPAGWGRPTLWQRGIEAGLDRNVFFGAEAELARWASG